MKRTILSADNKILNQDKKAKFNDAYNPLVNLLKIDVGQYHILNKLGLADYVRISKVSRGMYELIKPIKDSSALQKYINQEPNEDKVAYILRNNLNLLMNEFKEVVGNTQIFLDVTPLQLAYGAMDDAMCYTLKQFFIQFHNYDEKAAIDEMQKQINEMKDDHQSFDFDPIMQAISKESFNNGRANGKLILSPATIDAIDKFREDFTATQPKIIHKGMHFRWETIQELFKTAAAAEVLSNNVHHMKAILLEDAVLAWVLGYIPENSVQSFNQGLIHLQQYKESYKRAASTRDGYNFRDVLKKESNYFHLLEGSCVDIIFGRGERAELEVNKRLDLVNNYIDQKRQIKQNLQCRTDDDVFEAIVVHDESLEESLEDSIVIAMPVTQNVEYVDRPPAPAGRLFEHYPTRQNVNPIVPNNDDLDRELMNELERRGFR